MSCYSATGNCVNSVACQYDGGCMYRPESERMAEREAVAATHRAVAGGAIRKLGALPPHGLPHDRAVGAIAFAPQVVSPFLLPLAHTESEHRARKLYERRMQLANYAAVPWDQIAVSQRDLLIAAHISILCDLDEPLSLAWWREELARRLGASEAAIAQGTRWSPTSGEGRRNGWHIDAGVNGLRWSRWLQIADRDPRAALVVALVGVVTAQDGT